ncbi:hypothetical protein ACJMK2_043826 [Sinanodonta woodiana]|uniref:Uncharacterized protein n=1 Tax=Sinanodonta woodiana TaxID=1069815 RepID=A0ABD3W1C3_SINWO
MNRWTLNQSDGTNYTTSEQARQRAVSFEQVSKLTGSEDYLRPKSPFQRPRSASKLSSLTSVLKKERSPDSQGGRSRPTGSRESLAKVLDFDSCDSGIWTAKSSLRGSCQDLDKFPAQERVESPVLLDILYDHGQMLTHSPSKEMYTSSHHESILSVFPDTDSGFGSSIRARSRSGQLNGEDMCYSPLAMSRSRSLSRLNMNVSQELSTPPDSPRYRPFDISLRHLKDNLEDSENRRVVLMHKLKEAQDTLELQSDRLGKIEGTARGNTYVVEDLKNKEKEYRKKIAMLEKSDQEKEMLQMENFRLREEMQDRISKLDFQLRSLSAQHQVAENENTKRSSLLEHTTKTLALLEAENAKLQKDKDTLRNEILVAKEALEMARLKFTPIDDENKNLRNEVTRLREDNEKLTQKIHESGGQLTELRSLTQTMRGENERLADSWKTLTEEKRRFAKQLESKLEGVEEMKSRLSVLTTERDRLFQEKMDLNSKLQQMSVDKEQVEKSKMALEEQLNEHEEEVNRAKKITKRKDEEIRKINDELRELQQASDNAIAELSSVKAYYERALEQISVLENQKQLSKQQQDLTDQEKRRLQAEVERLKESTDSKSKDLKKEREQLEEAVLDLKSEIRQVKQEKARLEDRVHEYETKLQKANDDLKEQVTLKQSEVNNLRATCDRLSASVTDKDQELETLEDKIVILDEENVKLKEDVRRFKDEVEVLAENIEEVKKYKNENRKLLQEKAENEQMIRLLETQKDVLTKSSESSLAKLHDLQKLTEKLDHYKGENELLRERIGELEKVRDTLIKQKEELLANSDLIYKKPKLDELEKKIDELREANKQLRDINESVSEKCETLAQENVTLKDAIGGDGSVVPRVELERLAKEKDRMKDEYDHLKQEHDNLEERHQRFIINYGHDGTGLQKDKEEVHRLKREKEALEKQVALINGQMLLVEGGKKRLDEVVDELQQEIVQLRHQLEEAEKRYESLEDVGSDLSEMRNELHKLMSVIQTKDQAIETLENQLRTSKETLNFKEQAVSNLQHMVNELESRNEQLRKSVDKVTVDERPQRSPRSPRDLLSPTHSSRSPSPPKRTSILKSSRIPTRRNDEQTSEDDKSQEDGSKDQGTDIIKRIKPAESYMHMKQKDMAEDGGGKKGKLSKVETVPGQFGSVFISKQLQRSQSERGGDRLQSLISKYRSYSEAPERKIKPMTLSGSSKMGLVTKGRSFGPAAPKTDGKVSSETNMEGAEADLQCVDAQIEVEEVELSARQEGAFTQSIPLVHVDEFGGNRQSESGGTSTEGETDEDSEEDDDSEQRDISSLIDSCYRTHLSFLKELRKSKRKQRGGSARGTSRGA